LKNKRLKITGYSAESKEKINKVAALQQYKQFAIKNFIVKVKEKYSDCKVRIEEE
jgi:hypothetical protein